MRRNRTIRYFLVLFQRTVSPRLVVLLLFALLLLLLPFAADAATQSTLAPASDHAEGIEVLWWWMFAVAALVFISTMGTLGLGIWRGRRGGSLSGEASKYLVITAGVAVPLLVVLILVGGSLSLGRSIASSPPDGALHVRVTGWMWWWQIDYIGADGSVTATTANEMHVPVGRPVKLELMSKDVIHSFWVPELHGKTDLVPGRVNTSWFTASREGRFRGQCAEFCGLQHALMSFLVVAMSPGEFDIWLEHQARPAAEPDSEPATRGQQVFLNKGCLACHTVRGTSAAGILGPDLTHIASRSTLAAVTMPNNRGHLGGWILDPQSIKAGSSMPATRMAPDEFHNLLAYLESLT